MEEIKIKMTKNNSQKLENRSIINTKDLLNVLGRFCNSKFLLGIK